MALIAALLIAKGGAMYRVDRILAQICTASSSVNMKHVLEQMQYIFAAIYETLIRFYFEYKF